jgi:hypothetical protein
MRLPNRVTPYRKSTLAKFPVVLSALQEFDMSPQILYARVKKKDFPVTDFIEVLDCLFMLGKIEFVPGKEVLRYVGGSKLR